MFLFRKIVRISN